MKPKRLLLWVIAAAVLVRLASALYQGNVVVPTPGAHDQVSYDALARRVVGGHGFSFEEGWWPATRAGEPTAHWSFLQVLYLAAIYGAVGFQPVVARLIQAAVAGLVHPWLMWRIGRRLFGEKAAVASAALSAVYAYFIYYSGALMSETFHILGVLWVCDLLTGSLSGPATGQGSKSGYRGWVALGCALAVAVLSRQVFLLCIPALVGWSLWTHRASSRHTGGGRRALLGAARGWAVSLLILVMMILPFTWRNYRAFGMWVPLNTNAGFAFYWANHPHHGTSFQSILKEGSSSYGALLPERSNSLNEAALNHRLLGLGLGFVFEDPWRYGMLSLSRFKDYFKFWPSSDSSRLSNLARVGSFGMCLPLMLAGLWMAGRAGSLRLRRPDRTSGAVCLLLLLGVTYSAIHLASWALIRYRLPVDAVLLLFAGLGVVGLLDRLRGVSGKGARL